VASKGTTTRPALKSGEAVGRVLEEVGRALVGIAVDDGVRRADEDGVDAQGQSGAEKVVGRFVARHEGGFRNRGQMFSLLQMAFLVELFGSI
jgi:hypothetical protein